MSNQRIWTKDEEKKLKKFHSNGDTDYEIAVKMKKTEDSVRNKRARLRLQKNEASVESVAGEFKEKKDSERPNSKQGKI